MTAMTFSKREEVKAWEQEFVPCEHTLCLTQQDIENVESKGIYLSCDSQSHAAVLTEL